MKLSIFLIATLLIINCQPIIAQKKGYEKGYIINQKSDTVQGWVQDRDLGMFEQLYSQIRFVPEGKRRRKKYSPNDILGYGYGYKGTVFESVPLNEELTFFVNRYYLNSNSPKVFLRLIQRNEYLTYYEKEFLDEDNDMIESFPLFYKSGSDQMVRVSQGLFGLKRKRLKEYFQDCPTLITAIETKTITTVQPLYNFYSEQCQGTVE
jgi:hypothetical protein